MDVIIVTGASSGIGAATVARCLEAGYRVVGIDLQWPESAHDEVVQSRVQRHVADVRDLAALSSIAERLRDEDCPVVGLVCCAGIQGRMLMDQFDEAFARRVIEVNLLGVLFTMRAFVPLMIARGRGGAVVNVSSTAAHRARDTLGVYGASKAGVVQATRVAALEWARHGIRVNAVLPGPIDTPMARSSARTLLQMHESGVVPPELSARGIAPDSAPNVEQVAMGGAKFVPMGRMGRPEEVADAILFLLSDKASFITGEALSVSGGSILGYRAD